jgi:peptidyl-prolyl cis-trans isomerase B (cyclophilin B)
MNRIAFRAAAAVLGVALASAAFAQMRPIRLYSGAGRAVEVDVRSPRGEGDVLVRLLPAAGMEPVSEARVTPGRVDLARLFPELRPEGPKEARLFYAQVVAGGKPLGPPLVLQPMVSPPLARLGEDGKSIEWEEDDTPVFSGYRVWIDQHVVFDTTMGPMEFRMRPDAAPNTAWNFMELVRGGFFRDVIFHRIVAKRPDGSPFVVQAGDPSGTGAGGPGYQIHLERSTLPHDFGVISMARATDPNTAGSQFFVALSREGTQHLDGRYAAFGELVRGAETLKKLAQVPVGERDRPLEPPKIRSARLVDAPPRA